VAWTGIALVEVCAVDAVACVSSIALAGEGASDVRAGCGTGARIVQAFVYVGASLAIAIDVVVSCFAHTLVSVEQVLAVGVGRAWIRSAFVMVSAPVCTDPSTSESLLACAFVGASRVGAVGIGAARAGEALVDISTFDAAAAVTRLARACIGADCVVAVGLCGAWVAIAFIYVHTMRLEIRKSCFTSTRVRSIRVGTFSIGGAGIGGALIDVCARLSITIVAWHAGAFGASILEFAESMVVARVTASTLVLLLAEFLACPVDFLETLLARALVVAWCVEAAGAVGAAGVRFALINVFAVLSIAGPS
jgi:hypothetical protein